MKKVYPLVGSTRPDIVLTARRVRRALHIQAKQSASEENMGKDCQNVLERILKLEYNKYQKDDHFYSNLF